MGEPGAGPSPAVALFVGVLVVAVAFWAIFAAVLVRRRRRSQADQSATLANARPGWARMNALPSAEVSATLRANGKDDPGPATLLYGSVGVELRFGPDLFVALRWPKVADVVECDMSLLGTRKANGVRFVLVDGRHLEVRLFPSRELRRQHQGRSLQGAAVAELLAVRRGDRPVVAP